MDVETQRQWADLSILRITPALLSLFSVVTLLANLHARTQKLPIQQAAWYNKQLPTFPDALHIVQETLYSQRYFRDSLRLPQVQVFSAKRAKLTSVTEGGSIPEGASILPARRC